MTKDNHMYTIYVIILIDTILMLYSMYQNVPVYIFILPINGWALVKMYWKGYETGYKDRNKINDL